MATMATMATPRSRLKKILELGWVGVNQRTPSSDVFFTKFSLGVAKVAMVATANHRADLPLTVGLDYRRAVPRTLCTVNGCARGGLARSLADEAAPGGGRRASHLKPAAKSVATCTAAALSRSDRSLS